MLASRRTEEVWNDRAPARRAGMARALLAKTLEAMVWKFVPAGGEVFRCLVKVGVAQARRDRQARGGNRGSVVKVPGARDGKTGAVILAEVRMQLGIVSANGVSAVSSPAQCLQSGTILDLDYLQTRLIYGLITRHSPT